jgi:hypothetical protein
MPEEFTTHCDKCGKEIKVVKETRREGTFYLVHGLFCINLPAFFCEKDCFEKTVSTIQSVDYSERDEKGRSIMDVDVMINESLLIDKIHDIVYEVDNPLFPTLIFQRLLEVDPGNVRFLYALSSLYVGLMAADNTPDNVKEKLTERLYEVESDLKKCSSQGYEKLKRLREQYHV